MSWFSKLIPSRVRTNSAERKKSVPEGLWTKCTGCQAVLYKADVERNLHVCPKCECHMQLTARQRLASFFDRGEFLVLFNDITAVDFLKFRDSKKYKDRLQAAIAATGEQEALLVATGKLHGMAIVTVAFEFDFIGGSMGSAVGERFVRAVELAIERRWPLVCFASSGGARMQEGLISLLQMAKTSAALARLAQAKLPYISVMVNPTFGGVSASLAMLGDVNLAEPNTLIGFAGPRVIQQTMRQVLPEGFQRSEFLLQHGFLDQVVDRRQLRDVVYSFLTKFTKHKALFS